MLLKDICKSVSDTYSFTEKDVIFLNTGDILNGIILHNNFSKPSILPGQAKKSIKNDDLLYSEIRPINKHFAIVKVENPQDYVVSTKLMVIRKFNPNFNMKYLYQYLTSHSIIQELQNMAELRSGTFPQITFSELGSINIPEISLVEQQHIVNILGSLDEKIENNERIAKKLELLIKRNYQIFITKTETNIEKIKNITRCVLGGTPSRDIVDYWSGNIAWINSGKINEFRIIEASEYITEMGLQKSNTTLIPKNSTVVAITGATLGQVSILGIDACTNQSVVAVLENEKFPTSFIYPMICDHVAELINLQTGGAQQHINKGNIESFEFNLPNQKALKNYDIEIRQIFEKIMLICFKNQKLNELKQLYLKKFFC